MLRLLENYTAFVFSNPKTDAARHDKPVSITTLGASNRNIAAFFAGFSRRMVRLRRVSTTAIAQNLHDFDT